MTQNGRVEGEKRGGSEETEVEERDGQTYDSGQWVEGEVEEGRKI